MCDPRTPCAGLPCEAPDALRWQRRRMTSIRRITLTAALATLLLVLGAGGPGASTEPAAAAAPTAEALVGQRIMVAMQGTTPDAGLLTRIRLGRVGGVILFGSNIVNATQVKALTA